MGFRSNFRDLEEWNASTNGELKLNTHSNEAAKMYDATISQFLGWYEDPNLGGAGSTINAMLKADPEFLLGRALEIEFTIMGGMESPEVNTSLAKRISELNELSKKKEQTINSNDSVTELERFHVDIVNLWAKNNVRQVTKVLEKIITFYPNDMSALKMLQDNYFVMGQSSQSKNALASALPKILNRNPLKGYGHGMLAFAFEESNMYDESQLEVMKSLSLIPHDTWAIHNYAHCLEMQAKTDEGIKWMYDRKSDWQDCSLLACHQYWHTALFHINKGEFNDAINLLDNEILSRCTNGATSLNLHDGCSMVYRMELIDLFKLTNDNNNEGKNNDVIIEKRWKSIYETCKPHKEEHLWGFNDTHYMMAFLGMNDIKFAREFIDSIKQDDDDNEQQQQSLNNSIVKPLLEAMYQFKLKNYSNCVDILEEIRFDIIKIGGSHAQRDIFEQLLIVAALKSDKISHNKLGQRILTERDHLQGRRTIQTDLLAKQGNVVSAN